MKTFYVNIRSNTSADTLLALGWAEMLYAVCYYLGRPDEEIVLRHLGTSYQITLTYDLCEEELVNESVIPFLKACMSGKQDEKQGKKGRVIQDGFRYERELEKQRELVAQRKELQDPRLRRPEAFWSNNPELERIRKVGPHPELAHYKAINSLKGVDTFNNIVMQWQGLSALQQWYVVRLLYRLFSQQENDVEAACKAWEQFNKEQGVRIPARAPAVQVINPITGKGTNATKSNHYALAGMESFWPLELLKFKGFLLGAAPYTLKDKDRDNDRKTYVIQPEIAELQTLKRMLEQFRQICWPYTAVKQDVLALLSLAQVLVKHRHRAFTSRQGLEEWEPGPIIGLVRGFDVAFYKHLKAHAIMNVSTLNLPTWFPDLTTLQEVELADALIQEHLWIMQGIRGHEGKEGNEELMLLHAYRDFLSGHTIRPFWTFAALYGLYLFRQRGREKDSKKWLRQLSKKGLNNLVMSHKNTDLPLDPILSNTGFQRIASAIREATVEAQYRKQQGTNRYEIRYGLGQELLRKARYRDDFLNALNEFLFLYNTETAQVQARLVQTQHVRLETSDDYKAHHLRYPVTTADIQLFCRLLDHYPVELIVKMLLSYGHARFKALKDEEHSAPETDRDDFVEAE